MCKSGLGGRLPWRSPFVCRSRAAVTAPHGRPTIEVTMSRRFARHDPLAITFAFAALVALSCANERADLAKARVDMPASAPVPADQAAFTPAQAFAASDSSAVGSSESLVATRATARVAGAPPSPVAEQPLPGDMLVRMGNASVQVDSLDIGIERVRDMARRTGAVIANTSVQDGRERVRAASLELRIPSDRFDAAVTGLSPIGKLESVNVSVQDVGEEYVDVAARMTNARRLEQRLIELLANRTGKLTDVLRVENELARVRQEIERYEGRLRYLRARSSVSTLTIALHEPYPIVASRPGEHPLRDAFVQSWRNLVGFTAAGIASLGVLVPLALIVVALVLLGKRLVSGRLLRLPPQRPADSI